MTPQEGSVTLSKLNQQQPVSIDRHTIKED